MEQNVKPTSLNGSVSPPPLKRLTPGKRKLPDLDDLYQQGRRQQHSRQVPEDGQQTADGTWSTLRSSSITATGDGPAAVQDHSSHFGALLGHVREKPVPVLSMNDFESLFLRNAGSPRGHHFVIHQHDHPVAGLHYDLRLQISENSDVSWSIQKGLSGNVSEHQAGRRQAVETRIHAMAYHLHEGASRENGPTLIWDTGEYEVLPYTADASSPSAHSQGEDEGDVSFATGERRDGEAGSQTQSLCEAFRAGRIRVRLSGSRLPPGYTISLSLRRSLNQTRKAEGKPDPNDRRRRRTTGRQTPPEDSDKDDSGAEQELHTHSDDGRMSEAVRARIRAENAYPGASNTVNSKRGRMWALNFDKASSGFTKTRDAGRIRWLAIDEMVRANYPFFVRGRDVERSVVTGRLSGDILVDDGIQDFAPRNGWTPILK